MPTPRALDPEYLRTLLDPAKGGDPFTPRGELAARLTDHNRTLGSSAVVTTRLVIAAINRHRATWAADGFDLASQAPVQRELVRLLVANSGYRVADTYTMDTIMRHLRRLDRMRQGLPAGNDSGRDRGAQARAFEQRLRDTRRVVDVSPHGKPYVRHAVAAELDASGRLIEIVCASRELRQDSGTEGVRPS